MRTKISLEDVSKLFGRRTGDARDLLEQGASKDEVLDETGVTVALNDVTFDVPEGEIFVVMGLSGSGKSTLARCINRLIETSGGSIRVDGEDVTSMDEAELRELRRSKLGMVFQDFALLPHRTVLENVAFGLELQGVPEGERHERARDVVDTVGLSGWENHLPANLSGGMQQRVGLARALATDPDVLLMDEPFSSLDPLVRREMQDELLDLQERLRKTVVFITHDLDEAIKLGSEMAILRGGEVVQVGSPQEILRNPADDYVASFVEDVNPAQMLRARDVMVEADGKVRADHQPAVALRMMGSEEISSAFVVDEGGTLRGLLTADAAAEAADAPQVGSVRELDLVPPATTAPDTTLTDLVDLAADEPYPVAVVDDDRLLGIVKWVSIVRGLAGQDPEEAPAGAQQHAGGAPGEPEREAATAG